MAKKKTKQTSVKPKVSSAKPSIMRQLMTIFGVVFVALIFLATTLFLMIALLPSVIAFIYERSEKKRLYLAVGAMNFAGAFPFILKLWTEGNSVSTAQDILRDPVTILIIYGCALCGFVIDWFVVDLVSGILNQASKRRLRTIKKKQAILIERWGERLDPHYGETPAEDNLTAADS